MAPNHQPSLPLTGWQPQHVQREADGVCATALREIMLLKALNHPNIMALESMHVLPSELALCMAFPYAETGGWV